MPAGEGEKSFLWRVEGPGATVYLLGSIHALKEDSYPLAPAIEDAFTKVAKLAFEVDLDELNAAAFQMLAAGSLEGGRTLESVVGPELWAEFTTRTRAAGWDPAMCRTMKPWMAAVTLTSFEMMSAGYLSTAGVDTYFTGKAKKEGKERVALETVEFQVSLFADLTPEQSLSFLRYTLVDLETIVPQLDELTLLWKSGEIEPVEELLVEGFDEFPDLLSEDRHRSQFELAAAGRADAGRKSEHHGRGGLTAPRRRGRSRGTPAEEGLQGRAAVSDGHEMQR